MSAIKAGATFNELAKHPAEKIEALISYRASLVYKEGVTFEELAEQKTEKIDALTSDSVIEICNSGVPFKKLAEIYDENTDKFEALTSYVPILLYSIGVDLKELSDVYDSNQDKFKDLTQAIFVYQEIPFKEVSKFYDSIKPEQFRKLGVRAIKEAIEAKKAIDAASAKPEGAAGTGRGAAAVKPPTPSR